MVGLMAMGNSVVWQRGGDIWRCSYNSDAPVKIWESSTNQLLEFTFSASDQLFLLHCLDANGEFVGSLDPAKGQFPARFSEIARLARLPATNLMCVGGVKDFAYFTKGEAGRKALVIQSKDSPVTATVEWATAKSYASARSYAAGQKQIYVIGQRALTNDLVSIWRYDAANGSLACVVPNQETELKFAKNDAVSLVMVTNSLGDKLAYSLKSPAGFSASKKCPVVIGEGWTGYQLAVVGGGYCFANLSREGREMDQWHEDMMAVYDDLAKNPGIDIAQVYLLGISGGASVVNRLLEEKPGLWRGAILFSPVDFPDLTRVRVSKILIDSGGADLHLGDNGRARMAKFQDAALLAGIQVTVASHEDAGHVFNSVKAEKERVQELVKFLFEQ